MTYAGFWRRFGAFWLDFLVLLPLSALNLWGIAHYRLFLAYSFLPGTAFGFFYSVYLVRRYGGTPGKLMAGLRIRKINGAEIGYREAVLRYLPEWLLGLPGSIALIAATVAMSDADYSALPGVAVKDLTAVMPRWQHYTSIAFQIWIWSEFVVMMTNRKRRAIHDFIAGTIVIVERRGNSIAAPTSASDRA